MRSEHAISVLLRDRDGVLERFYIDVSRVLRCRTTAIDRQHRTVHEARRGARQKHDRRCDLLGPGRSTGGGEGGELINLSHLDTGAWRAWRDLIVDFQRERDFVGGCPIGSIASQLADTDELARLALVAGFDQWEDEFRSRLITTRARGLLEPDADPHALALATLAALQGGLLLCQIRKSVEPLEVALDAALDNILRRASISMHTKTVPMG